jgi:hypothetical protein
MITRLHLRRLPLVLALSCALQVSGVHAVDPRNLAWDDLIVKVPVADNPFATLSIDNLTALSEVAATRDRKARGNPVLPQQLQDERAATRKLEKAGIDVDGLLAQRQAMAEKHRVAANAVNPALDGKVVRMPGYVLPLEFSGKQVSEFLLVPWVGACIHTPPPAANQIVHVRPDKPVDINGAFASVWVTGRMAAKPAKHSLYLTDGASEIDVGYSMAASQVEPYKQ